MEQTIINLEREWMEAWIAKDEARLDEIMDPDYTLTTSILKGKLINKTEAIDKAMNHYDCQEFNIKEIKVRHYGITAVVNALINQKATADGEDWSGDFLITDVWVKAGVLWQVVARHRSWLK
jgi:ketosteroid isomerase-like protein